jgi:hypothetical protein
VGAAQVHYNHSLFSRRDAITEGSPPDARTAVCRLPARRRWKEALSLASGTLYHDLSSDPGFMGLYQRGLFLPHTDEESYRSVLAAEVS